MNEEEISGLLKPTKFDQKIGQIFPGWAAKRQRARREFAYEAARNTRLRPSAKRLQGPEDYTAFGDRLQLIREMRELKQNFGLFQSIIDKLAIYAFGRIRYQAHTLKTGINDQYEDYLAECFANCDISGRHNFWNLTCIAFKSALTDGDYVEQTRRDRDSSLKLVGIEGDRLGGIIMGSPMETYFQGISIDPDTGRPISYRVYQRTKADAYINPIEIPSSDITHYYDPFRIDQYRGITPFAPVINEAKDLKEVLEACLIGTKFENYHAAIQYTENGLGLNSPGDYFTGSDTLSSTGQAVTEQALKFGLIQSAPTGSKIEFMKSDRPGATFQTYLDTLIRLIGTALNLPHGFVYNLMGLTGPAARMDAQQAQRTIQWHQQNMIDRRLNKLKNMWLMDGIAKGDIPYTEKWNKGEWQFPPAPTIDVGRESAAAVQEVRMGMRSKESWYGENGQDAEEQQAKIAEEAERMIETAKAIAERQQIPLDLALTTLEVRLPNGYLAHRTISATSVGETDDPVVDEIISDDLTPPNEPPAKPAPSATFALKLLSEAQNLREKITSETKSA